jgi:hypothetical protein
MVLRADANTNMYKHKRRRQKHHRHEHAKQAKYIVQKKNEEYIKSVLVVKVADLRNKREQPHP